MPNSKHRRKKRSASGRRSSSAQSEAQPHAWHEKKLHTSFKSQPRQVEKKYWRQ